MSTQEMQEKVRARISPEWDGFYAEEVKDWPEEGPYVRFVARLHGHKFVVVMFPGRLQPGDDGIESVVAKFTEGLRTGRLV